MTQAIGYVRVSTQEQADEGVSLAAQRRKVIAYCDAHDLELIDIFEDAGVSGKSTANRPGVQDALEKAKETCAHLVVCKLDRLTRSTLDAVHMIETAASECWELRAIEENIDTSSAMGKFMATVMAGIAQLGRDQISENTSRALRELKLQGHRLGRCPFGLVEVIEDGVRTFVEDADAMPIVEMILEKRAAGKSFEAIATDLNEDGHRAKEGGAWIGKQVNRVWSRWSEMRKEAEATA